MKIKRIGIFLIVLLAAAGLAQWILQARRSNELGSRVFGGSRAFHAFRSAAAITAQRLHCKQADGSWALGDYSREAPVRLSDRQLSELKRVFSDRTLYDPQLWTLPPGERLIMACGAPNYGVLFTTQSRPVVQIALCFRCDQFGVFLGENGDPVNRSDRLAYMQPLLVTLIKSIYPSDAQLQAIKREDWLDLTKR